MIIILLLSHRHIRHSDQIETKIDQLTVEENTGKNIIADDLQICDGIVLDLQENKKRLLKPRKKI